VNERAKSQKTSVMNTKVHVNNLAAMTTEKDLDGLFSAYGNQPSLKNEA
jgi:hypothetical protein